MFLTAAVNPRPSLALRLLTWTSPSLPIGAWLAGMAAGGAALSAGATALALRAGSTMEPRRRLHLEAPSAWSEREHDQAQHEARRWRGGGDREAAPQRRGGGDWAEAPGDAGPSRDPGQPAPTISVPFRVIRGPDDRPVAPDSDSGRTAQRRRQAEPVPVPAWEDDWGSDDSENW